MLSITYDTSGPFSKIFNFTAYSPGGHCSLKGANFSKLSIFSHIFDLEGVSIDDLVQSIFSTG